MLRSLQILDDKSKITRLRMKAKTCVLVLEPVHQPPGRNLFQGAEFQMLAAAIAEDNRSVAVAPPT